MGHRRPYKVNGNIDVDGVDGKSFTHLFSKHDVPPATLAEGPSGWPSAHGRLQKVCCIGAGYVVSMSPNPTFRPR